MMSRWQLSRGFRRTHFKEVALIRQVNESYIHYSHRHRTVNPQLGAVIKQKR
jgi:hypothetical protein